LPTNPIFGHKKTPPRPSYVTATQPPPRPSQTYAKHFPYIYSVSSSSEVVPHQHDQTLPTDRLDRRIFDTTIQQTGSISVTGEITRAVALSAPQTGRRRTRTQPIGTLSPGGGGAGLWQLCSRTASSSDFVFQNRCTNQTQPRNYQFAWTSYPQMFCWRPNLDISLLPHFVRRRLHRRYRFSFTDAAEIRWAYQCLLSCSIYMGTLLI
jgi:hypothetical protein